MRVRQGELAYFREDDLANALNILTLATGVSSVTKKGSDMFVVHTNKKSFTFRVPPPLGYVLKGHPFYCPCDNHPSGVSPSLLITHSLSHTLSTTTLPHTAFRGPWFYTRCRSTDPSDAQIERDSWTDAILQATSSGLGGGTGKGGMPGLMEVRAGMG